MATIQKKLRWYPQQPYRFIFANLSEACCEAKPVEPEPSPEPCGTWSGSAPKPPRPSPEPSPLLNLTWLCTKASQNLLRNQLNLTWLCTKTSWNLLRNLLQNPVEPDLALHQSLPEPSPKPSPEPCWTWPGMHQSLPDLHRNLRNLYMLHLAIN